MASYVPVCVNPALEMERNGWIVQMDKQVQQQRITCDQRRPSIACTSRPFYRVPEHAREEHPSLYVPQEISIGPYHYQKGEYVKQKCLINFLSRSYDKLSLKDYTDRLAEILDELIDMYDGLDNRRWRGEDKKESFLRMMIIDACYLLEIMIEAIEARHDDPRPDAIFNSNEMEIYRHDMLLFDNQIPFKVLVRILEISGTLHANVPGLVQTFSSPRYLIHEFFSLSGWSACRTSSLHLLEDYQMVLIGDKTSSEDQVALPVPYDMLPSATQLEEAQIAIRPSIHKHQTYISLVKRTGLVLQHSLVLQQIVLDRATRLNFHQVILYERFHRSPTNTHFSSYIYFMNSLLKDAADSRLLRTRGILRTTLPDEEVIEMFNGLSKIISFHGEKKMINEIGELMSSLREQFNKNMQAWRKDLFQTYLRSPWGLLSIFVAFLIFIFTGFQTLYTILGYYKGKK